MPAQEIYWIGDSRTFYFHRGLVIAYVPDWFIKCKGQAPFQRPAPFDQQILTVLFKLQQPLRRENFSCQPIFHRRGLIQRLGQRLKDRFHDVVRIAAVHEIHM